MSFIYATRLLYGQIAVKKYQFFMDFFLFVCWLFYFIIIIIIIFFFIVRRVPVLHTRGIHMVYIIYIRIGMYTYNIIVYNIWFRRALSSSSQCSGVVCVVFISICNSLLHGFRVWDRVPMLYVIRKSTRPLRTRRVQHGPWRVGRVLLRKKNNFIKYIIKNKGPTPRRMWWRYTRQYIISLHASF